MPPAKRARKLVRASGPVNRAEVGIILGLMRLRNTLKPALLVAFLTLILGDLENTAAERPVPVVVIALAPDGALIIDGHKYSTDAAIREKMKEVASRKPTPNVELSTSRDVNFEAVGRVIIRLQKAGVPKIAFLIEPRSH